MSYGLFGKFIATDGDRDRLVDILIEASELLRANDDCIHYVVGKGSEPNEVWVSEVWTSEAAHDAALEPEDIRNLIMTARPLIADMPQGTAYEVIGGKGI